MRTFLTATLLLVFGLCTPGVAQILNGNFETGALGPWSSTGSVGIGSSLGEGNFSAVLSGGSISQSFATITGQTYAIDFDFRALLSQQYVTFEVDGSNGTVLFSFSFFSASSPHWASVTDRNSFVADGSFATVILSGSNVAVDSVVFVPEPSCVALAVVAVCICFGRRVQRA